MMRHGLWLAAGLCLAAAQGFAQSPPLARAEAVQLALDQASVYSQAKFAEQIAAEDVTQARAALYPKVNAVPGVIYNTPALRRPVAGEPRPPSFLGANAITEYQALVSVSGEWDKSGRLKTAVRRNQALLEAAHAGTEAARLALAQATNEAYYGLALAAAQRQGAEMNLQTAQDFARATKLLLDAGEVAPVDYVRANLQANTRNNELEQARAAENAAADALRLLIGYPFTQPVAVFELLLEMPEDGAIERYTEAAIAARPELAQFAAEERAAALDVKIAQTERRAQFSYTLEGGFISASPGPLSVVGSTGVRATVGVTLPLWDKGASRSRATQATLRAAALADARQAATRVFAQQFYTARAAALSAAVRIKQTAAGINDAERNLVASQARYHAGEAQIIEVTDAQNTLAAQRAALYQAAYDYHIARTRLLQAVGQ